MPTVERELPAPLLTEDEQKADMRINLLGVPFLNKRYAFWRQDAAHSPVRIADPQHCLICYVDGANRFFGNSASRNYNDLRWRLYIPPTFHEVLKSLDLTYDMAVKLGFARAETDPITFYAALRDRWAPHFRDERMRAA